MAKGSITMRVENLQKLLDQVQEIDEKGRKAVKATVRDVKSQRPGLDRSGGDGRSTTSRSQRSRPPAAREPSRRRWPAAYRSEARPSRRSTITYSGRLLTPVHFGMTPKTPPAGKSYTLKMQVRQGPEESHRPLQEHAHARAAHTPQRSHNILMGTGNTKADGVGYIPIPANEHAPAPTFKKFTTISVPQMITSDQDQRDDHAPDSKTETGQATPAQPRREPSASRATANGRRRARQRPAARAKRRSRTRRRARPTPAKRATEARQSAAQTPPRPRTAPQGTVTRPLWPAVLASPKNAQPGKIFFGPFRFAALTIFASSRK